MNNYNNNFYGQNPNPAFGYGYQNGFGYNRPAPLPNPTNPLTKEEIALLKQKSPAFSLAVDRIEALQAICTHRDATGDKLISHPDGTLECTLCGTRFRPAQAPQETIEGCFNEVVDILETMKTMYIDIPEDVAKGIFQMIPYLKKCPKLWSIANDHYSRYAGTSTLMNRDYNSGNVMNMFAAMMNPMAGMNPGAAMYNQPAYGQPMYGQPMMNQPQQPVPDVTMGAANAGVNPFDAGSQQQPQQVTDNKQFNL
jgi:hypothetical protein